jgi:hypothetical protein
MKPCLIGNIIIVSAQVWRPAERFSQLVWVFARFERSITRALGHQESGTAFGRGKDPRGDGGRHPKVTSGSWDGEQRHPTKAPVTALAYSGVRVGARAGV